MNRVVIISLKQGMPTVEEARTRLKTELDRARRSGATAAKIIHGYGSSGFGGAIRPAIRKSLRKRVKEKQIRAFVPGEAWDVFDEDSRRILDECPDLRGDEDLGRYNEGITIVLL